MGVAKYAGENFKTVLFIETKNLHLKGVVFEKMKKKSKYGSNNPAHFFEDRRQSGQVKKTSENRKIVWKKLNLSE